MGYTNPSKESYGLKMQVITYGKNIRISGKCLSCQRHVMVEMSGDDYEGWIGGWIKTQNIAGINIDEREWLISQICGECFDALGGE